MTYNITIDVPDNIVAAQEQRAFLATDGNVQFHEMIVSSIETAMNRLTGNVVHVKLV